MNEIKLEKKLSSKIKDNNNNKINIEIPKTIPIKNFIYENKNKIKN